MMNGLEPVVTFKINGEARAYPLAILTWHEVVNDVVGGVPVTVTFCPLCNSAWPSNGRWRAGYSTSGCRVTSGTATSSCGTDKPRPGGSNSPARP